MNSRMKSYEEENHILVQCLRVASDSQLPLYGKNCWMNTRMLLVSWHDILLQYSSMASDSQMLLYGVKFG